MNKNIKHLIWIVILTALFEGLTVLLRFGLELESTRDTSLIAYFTFGYRIHHSYVGAVMVLIAMFLKERPFIKDWGIRIGWALVASDLIHHFLVLWPILGDPQFHLVYPGWHN